MNTLQRTEWAINLPLLEVMENLWARGQGLGNLPAREDIPLPPYPFPDDVHRASMTESQLEMFRTWSRKRSHIYSENNRSVSKRVQVERTLQVAREYANRSRFYYVWQNDFRSRKYASSTFLTPQSADWSKALLTFARGVPINNWEDAQWLCIHGANLYGNDKVSLVARETWAWNYFEEAERIVEDPYTYDDWLRADKPFQFLAWCYEIVALMHHGWGYESHLPCSADGSCNGLQHLSAILRDERGGRATNLLPASTPQDIYTEVAEETIAKVAQDDTELARKCLLFGIDRKLVKRSVMIVPYSGTRHACRAYIEEALQDKIKNGAENLFGDDLFQVTTYLAGHVWDSIAGVIQSARKVMQYVKEVGEVYTNHERHMEWVTPTGWLVLQQYKETEQKRIKTHINGEVVSLSFPREKEDSVHRRRTGLGSSPNFIHSLDAAALTKTINKASPHMNDFAMVHDSYGTHSTYMPNLSEILRECFVQMYEENDVLQNLRNHAILTLDTQDVPEPPAKGSLDISKVLDSQYFFA